MEMPENTTPKMPPGLLSGVLFFLIVFAGCAYIILSKLYSLNALLVTAVPVVIMIAYATVLGLARLFRLRDDQSGDNLYYMGFLFTLTSLGVSLYQFSATGSSEQIVQNFGIAIASTIAGIALRIFFNQMRRDPVEVEATARLELAEASRRVKRELEGSVLDFAYFRRMSQQSITDALAEIEELMGDVKDRLTKQMSDFAKTTNKPLEDASKASGDTITRLNSQIAETIENSSERMAAEADRLSKSTDGIVRAIDTLIGKFEKMQTPDNIIEIKLQPMIQGLSRAVNAFDKSVEAQTRVVDVNLEQTRKIANALVALAAELRATNIARVDNTSEGGPWGSAPARMADVDRDGETRDG